MGRARGAQRGVAAIRFMARSSCFLAHVRRARASLFFPGAACISNLRGEGVPNRRDTSGVHVNP